MCGITNKILCVVSPPSLGITGSSGWAANSTQRAHSLAAANGPLGGPEERTHERDEASTEIALLSTASERK